MNENPFHSLRMAINEKVSGSMLNIKGFSKCLNKNFSGKLQNNQSPLGISKLQPQSTLFKGKNTHEFYLLVYLKYRSQENLSKKDE